MKLPTEGRIVRSGRPLPWLAPALVVGGLAPLARVAVEAWTGGLGANPIAEALNRLGLTALVLLLASLACTPLRLLWGWTWPLRVRRLLGRYAFAYAALHVATYVSIDQGGDWGAIVADVAKHRFILAGAATFALLVPLAATSSHAAQRRLGVARWQRLHRLVYPAAILAVTHFVWRVKIDVREPAVYAVVLAALLLVRILRRRGSRQATGS